MSTEDVRRALHGAWRVVGYDDRSSPDDPWTPSYGDDVDGLIVYDASGSLSVSVAGAGRYDSYFGTFDVIDASSDADGFRGVLEHTVVASNMPGLSEIDGRRPFRLAGNTLVLGDEVLWRRMCRKLRLRPDA